MEKKLIITICAICLMLVFSGTIVNAGSEEISNTNEINLQNFRDCPINITVQEAWDLLTDTGNGIQIPIDVRYEEEWNYGFIDTPYPECPIRYEYDEFMYNASFLEWFLDEFAGQELVIYCASGGRSIFVSNILCISGFTGIVNNMLGGINGWKTAGYPIRNNTAPDAPDINGPKQVKVNTPTDYTLSTTDLESDVVFYWIKWCNDNTTEWDGPYESGEDAEFTYTWCHKGTFTIEAKAMDFYGWESNVTELEITVPRNKAIGLNLLNILTERFPQVVTMFRYLLLRLEI
jgi:rhodanese-related sulfurtransferase